MKQYQIAEAKSRFSEVLKTAEAGELVQITRGRKHEPVVCIVHPSMLRKQAARELGTLQHWGEIGISSDWEITDEELLGL
ncbi:MAG: prevent-host-death protein [Coriobacteriia bacterium]|nr:prevent-host-death protein [Coriobacteriia bacterium]